MSPLLRFDEFETAVPMLLDALDRDRALLPPRARLGEEGVLAPLGMAIRLLAAVHAYVDEPRQPGVPYERDGGTEHGDVRDDAARACTQRLEALHAVQSHAGEPTRTQMAATAGERIAREAFDTFGAPGGLPVPSLEWSGAISQAADALGGLYNPHLGEEIGVRHAHDALVRAAGHAICALAMIDAELARPTLHDAMDPDSGWTLACELEDVPIPDRAGRPFVIARVPRITRRFHSPMHTVQGMPPRLGSWHEEFDAYANELLPSARLREDSGLPNERAALTTTIATALTQGHAASLHVNAAGDI